MKLEEYLIKKKWTSALFAKLSGIPSPVIWRYLKKGVSLSLDSALLIEVATEGEVTAWDISRNADAIKNRTFREIDDGMPLLFKKRNKKAKEESKEHDEQQNDMKTEISIMTQPIT